MKNKRIVERPLARKRNGGWIIQRQALIEALKKGELLELNDVRVGASQLGKLLKLFPYEECFISGNGSLVVETVERYYRSNNGQRKVGFRRPKHYFNSIRLFNGAWLKRSFSQVVVLRPRKY